MAPPAPATSAAPDVGASTSAASEPTAPATSAASEPADDTDESPDPVPGSAPQEDSFEPEYQVPSTTLQGTPAALAAIFDLTSTAVELWEQERYTGACALIDEAVDVADLQQASLDAAGFGPGDDFQQALDVLDAWKESCLPVTEADPTVEDTPEPDTTPEADPTVEDTPEPDTTPEADPTVEDTPEPDTTPEADPTVEDTPEPDTTPEADPTVDSTEMVLEELLLLLTAAAELADGGQMTGACALIDEASDLVAAHVAVLEALNRSGGSDWREALDVMAAWENDCTAALDQDSMAAATAAAMTELFDLTAAATDLWGQGRIAGACALIVEARAVVDAHNEALAAEGSTPSGDWQQAQDVLAEWEQSCEAPPEQELIWVAPFAGYVPEVHPDTPTPSWEQPDFNYRNPGDQPRPTPGVQRWAAWCGGDDNVVCQDMLFTMAWPLDYLGADEECVLAVYYARFLWLQETGQTNYNQPGLIERFGWHRCATVIDPRTPTEIDPFLQELFPSVRLLTPNPDSLADRCREVLPPETSLGYSRGSQVFDGLGCDEWGAYIEGRSTRFPACSRSSRLAWEWMEHHHDKPLYFWAGFPC